MEYALHTTVGSSRWLAGYLVYMPVHALRLEFGAGLLAGISVLLSLTSSAARRTADAIRQEKRQAVSEALTIVGLPQPPERRRLIVHNGLSATRPRR